MQDKGEGEEATSAAATECVVDPFSFTKDTTPQNIPLELLPKAVELCKQDDDKSRLQGAMLIRKMLSVYVNPPIEEVVESDVCPKLVEFLKRDDFTELQFEAAGALTNVASATATHAEYVIQLGALPLFINLLDSPDENCREQACWVVGNIAGTGYKFRDEVLSQDVMDPLLRCIQTPCEKISCLQNAVWALSNMCRSKPQPTLELVAPCLPIITPLLKHENREVVIDACWTISYISDGPQDRIQALLDAVELDEIVCLLGASESSLITPAIRTIGNIATGSDDQTQKMVESKAIEYFWTLLEHERQSIRKETAWTISNICAGTQEQIEEIILNGLMYPIVQCMEVSAREVRKDAVYCVANIASGGSPEQVRCLIECGYVMEVLCRLLDETDPKILELVLETLDNLLQRAERDKREEEENTVAEMLRENGVSDKIELLQDHDNDQVSAQARTIVHNFFQ